jgi:hypothetical protein
VFLMCDGINECRCLWLHNVKVWRPSSHRFFVYVLTLEREPYFLSFCPVPSFNSLCVVRPERLQNASIGLSLNSIQVFDLFWYLLEEFLSTHEILYMFLFLSICRMGILRMMPFVS